jgi:hypothetical protein
MPPTIALKAAKRSGEFKVFKTYYPVIESFNKISFKY